MSKKVYQVTGHIIADNVSQVNNDNSLTVEFPDAEKDKSTNKSKGDCLDPENTSKYCFLKVANAFLLLVVFLQSIILFIYAPRVIKQNQLGFDYMGVIVAILAILVAFLVAWQIWQTIASRDNIKEARVAAKKANKIANEVNLLNVEFKESLNLFAAYQSSSNGLSFLLRDRHFKAFHLFATAIIDSLHFIKDHGRCAMSAFVNLENCINFDENEESMNEYKKNWDNVTGRLQEIENAIRGVEQENVVFQAMAKHHIDEFKKAAREKGFKI